MIDIRIIREREADVRTALKNRGSDFDLDGLLALDARWRTLVTERDALNSERNARSKEIGRLRASGADTSAAQAEVRALGERIAAIEREVREIEAERDARLLLIPNLPHSTTPVGPDASGNVVVRTWGRPREFPFPPRPHWEIGESLGLFDLSRAARMSGAGFPLFKGFGAELRRALIRFMLDLHTREHGYTEIAPPYLCTTAAMTGTGQLPRLAADMYRVTEEDLWLIPTAEVPLTNLYREEIITQPLPICVTAYSPCFRREAGAAGRDTRGIIRVHQFDKVELVRFVEPARSYEELEILTGHAEAVLQRLGLPYRVVALCTGDLSFAAAKCYDLELWAPGHGGWLEVSSCSNFEDFQARRAGIRYRRADGKVAFVHTLNGSGVALPRLLVALLENGQQADGSVELPEALAPYLNGRTRIEPPA